MTANTIANLKLKIETAAQLVERANGTGWASLERMKQALADAQKFETEGDDRQQAAVDWGCRKFGAVVQATTQRGLEP